MKITTTQLKQIIREEIQKMKLNEGAPSSKVITTIKQLMNKHKSANGKTGFVKFAEELETALPDYKFDYVPGNPNQGIRHGFNWAIDNYNFASVKADGKGMPDSDIYAQGGPGNNWILRKW